MIKTLSLVLLLIFQSQVVHADENMKILLHLNDTFKLEHLKNSVKNIRTELGKKIKIKVVINGKAVQLMLQNNKSSTEIINSILSYNVDIGLCHNAIRNNNIKKKLLIKGLKVLPEDGNVTVYKSQKKGYTYIKM